MLILKALIYRVIRVAILFMVAIVVGGDIEVAIGISLVDFFVATLYYYIFEIVWNKLNGSSIKQGTV